MRRCAAILFLAAFAASAGLRLSAAGADTEAMRCAVACGHAAGQMKGGACCPMADATGTGPLFRTCSRGGPMLASSSPGQPALLVATRHLSLPCPGATPGILRSATPRLPFVRPPDHVPLLLG